MTDQAQCDELLAALTKRPMTAMEILLELGIARASARIYGLRQQGHPIHPTKIILENHRGKPCRMADGSLRFNFQLPLKLQLRLGEIVVGLKESSCLQGTPPLLKRLQPTKHCYCSFIDFAKIDYLFGRLPSHSQCKLVIVEPELVDGSHARPPNSLKIVDGPWKHELKNPQTFRKILPVVKIGPYLTHRNEQAHYANDSRTDHRLQIVQPFRHACYGGECNRAEGSQQQVRSRDVVKKDRIKIGLVDVLGNSTNFVQIQTHLSSDLHQDEKPLFVISELLALKLPHGYLDRDACGGVGSASKSIGKGAQHDSCNDRQSRTDGRPRVPPDDAALRQRPTLANTIQHAHSLIPLWIGRHFAMGRNGPQEASYA